MLAAYLEEQDLQKAWRIYVAEQLWTLNAAWRDRYEYPHYVEMINAKSKEEQHAADEREKQQVYEWLMGGEDL